MHVARLLDALQSTTTCATTSTMLGYGDAALRLKHSQVHAYNILGGQGMSYLGLTEAHLCAGN